jgi:glycosyltransferase involved in cell wall biosynthesis
MEPKLLFIGISGKEYPHTRVRCYNFARILQERYGIPTEVLSFKEDLAKGRTERDMYESLRDREKLRLTIKAFRRLWAKKGVTFYIQKAHFHSAAPYFLHRLGRNPYIFDYDDYDIPLSNFFVRGRYNRMWFGTNRYDEITHRLAGEALLCVVSSHFLQDYLGQFSPSVHLVETGVDSERFTPPESSRESETVSFFWNGIVWGEPIYRNVIFALDCFQKVHASCSNSELVLAAQGLWMDRVREVIGKDYAGLPVRILDWVKPEEMPDLLRSVDVGLLPLVQREPWVQAKSPTKLYEYMAAGLPVVASANGEAEHIIEDGTSGILVSEEEEFIEGMRKVCEDRDYRAALGGGARRRIEDRYSLDRLGERLHDAVRGVLD